MDGKKKIWATAVLCAVASVGFVVPAGAEETMTHDLDEVIVEADRNTLRVCAGGRRHGSTTGTTTTELAFWAISKQSMFLLHKKNILKKLL